MEFNPVNEINGDNEIDNTNEIDNANEIDSDKKLPTDHGRKTASWPKNLFHPDPNMSQHLNRKRLSPATSYAQGVKQGQYPPSHTPAYESKILRPAGIILDPNLGEESISDDFRKLCNEFVDTRCDPPESSLFEEDLFWKVSNGVLTRNEARRSRS